VNTAGRPRNWLGNGYRRWPTARFVAGSVGPGRPRNDAYPPSRCHRLCRRRDDRWSRGRSPALSAV